MLKYVSLMVTAYRNATGKSVEEALNDLSIASIVQPSDLHDVAQSDLLQDLKRDNDGIRSWLNTNSGATL